MAPGGRVYRLSVVEAMVLRVRASGQAARGGYREVQPGGRSGQAHRESGRLTSVPVALNQGHRATVSRERKTARRIPELDRPSSTVPEWARWG